ncbi:MAG TPA: hypothetical protein VFY90_09530 [Tepidiformaceae bacterium]|nr:hypothetical protein [Tepidiformaceae bacterium]
MRPFSVRLTALTLAVFSLLALGGCSSKSDDEPHFDPKRADELAHAMMPEAAVFPGTGWEVVSEDEFDDDAEDDSPTPDACKDIERVFKSSEDFIDEEPRGRARTEYELKTGDEDALAIPTSIDVEVEIHDEAQVLKDGLVKMKDLLGHADFKDCMDAVMEQEMGSDPVDEGVTLDMKVVDSELPAPRNGATMAFDANIDAAGLVKLDMRLRIFFWRVGNSAITVMFAGPKDALTDEFMRTALDRVDGTAIVASKQ